MGKGGPPALARQGGSTWDICAGVPPPRVPSYATAIWASLPTEPGSQFEQRPAPFEQSD